MWMREPKKWKNFWKILDRAGKFFHSNFQYSMRGREKIFLKGCDIMYPQNNYYYPSTPTTAYQQPQTNAAPPIMQYTPIP
jgi:hypothetical protein